MKFDFEKRKYGRELLVDCEKISDVKTFVKSQMPFCVSFYEILFLTKGKGVFRLDEEKIKFKRGTILLLPPNKWRQWAVVNQSFDGYFLIFEEEFIHKFFNDALFLYRFHYFYNRATPSFVQADDVNFLEMVTKLKEIQIELKGLRNDSSHLLRSLLYYLLIKINRIYEQRFKLKEDHLQDVLALRFRKQLEKNIVSEQKVSYYADQLQVSRSHLNKTLKRYYGKSCSEIIKERLVLEIKKALMFSDKSISEIAYDLNFSEPGNLNRFFKKMCNITPLKYRLLNSE